MNSIYEFEFALDKKPIFSKDGVFYVNRLLDPEHIAVDLFTDDVEGFTEVTDLLEYTRIREIVQKNSVLRKISIVSAENDALIVAIKINYQFEYFQIHDMEAVQVTDKLAQELADTKWPKRVSLFSKPFVVTMQNGEVTKIK